MPVRQPMKLRWIMLINFTAITGLFMAAMVAITHFILLGSYAELEESHVRDDLQRIQNALQAEIQAVDVTLHDYSTWDETYESINGSAVEYESRNLSEVTMQNLGMRSVLIVNRTGQVWFLRSFRPGSANEVSSADRDVLVRIAEKSRLMDESQALSGVVSFSDGPALVSARHVLRTSGMGPSGGVMVMARELDYRMLTDLSTRVKTTSSLTEVQKLSMDRASLLGELQNHPQFASRVVDDDSMAGFALIRDVWGEPKFLLEIRHDRDIWREGDKSAHILYLSILVLGVAFGSISIWRARGKIIRPIEEITQCVRAFRDDSGMVARLQLSGSAEIVQLGRQVNEMLDEIQLSNQRLVAARERLKFEATHDPLTGAWNCAAALELLDREIGRSEREGETVAVLMLDLDHFKFTNDQLGHAAGDLVLRTVTASISAILRTADVLARYGGDEFLLIAPKCTKEQARGLAERILLRLQTMPVQVAEQKIRITASIGIAAGSFPFSSEELIALADRALYRAKENGRNCFEVEDAAPTRVKGALYCMPRRDV